MEIKHISSEKIECYFCYANADKPYLDKLEEHLSILYRRGLIKSWSRKSLRPGDHIDNSVSMHLERADIIIILASSDLFATDYLYNKEMEIAVHRHKNGQCVLVPVLVRNCDIENSILNEYQILPSNGHPIESKTWDSKDEPYREIVKDITTIVNDKLNEKVKQKAIEENRVRVLNKSEEIDEEANKLGNALKNILVEQIISAPYDCEICLYPAIGTRAEPVNSSWNVQPCVDQPLLLDEFKSIVESHGYRHSRPYPILSVISSEKGDFQALYVQPYSHIENLVQHKALLKKGDRVCKLLVPLLKILENKEEIAHWTFGRGDSIIGNVLSYQPDLSYWGIRLKPRLVKLDRTFGCLKIRSSQSGQVKMPVKITTGSAICKGDLLATVGSGVSISKITSPVDGTMSSFFVREEEYISSNQPIANIRTFPLLLLLDIEEHIQFSENNCYSIINSPVNGTILKENVTALNYLELPIGNEITVKDAVVCIIKTKDILFGITISEFSGIVVKNYFDTKSEIKVGDPLFKLCPKIYLLRAPMIGQFYRASSPDAFPYVNINDRIEIGSVVCIIEAVKLNNEIECAVSGTVLSILVDDAEHVNYKQPLFKIQLY